MDILRQDLRYALRGLLRSPGYTFVAVLSLALGIAGNAVLFTIVNGLLLKPLPVAEPSRVAAVYTSDYSGTRFGASSYPDLVDFRQAIPAFDHITGMQLVPTSLADGGETTRIVTGLVSADFFDGLGVPLSIGRGFTPDQERPGAEANVVVLSHGLWTTRFGADRSIVGRPVRVGGQLFTVVGVAAPGFTGVLRGIGQEAWVPFGASPAVNPGNDFFTERGNRSLFLYGHLGAGRSLGEAQDQAVAAARQLSERAHDEWTTLRGETRVITVLPEAEARLFPDARTPVLLATLLLFLVVGAVLLIACANVANLSLSRALARRREIAIRVALGASRRRIVAQLLAESLLVAIASGGLGLLAAGWLNGLAPAMHLPVPVPVALDLSLDSRVVLFTVAVTLVAGATLGLAPALQVTRPSLVPALKDQGAPIVAGRSRLRGLFVVTQVAFALPLLALAVLFGRSVMKSAAIDPGFGARDGLVLSTDWGLTGWNSERGHLFQRQLAERVRALPGVTAAGLTETLPLSLSGNRSNVTVEGYASQPGEDMEVGRIAAGPGLLEALEVPLLDGRSFTDADRATAPGVVVVSAAFATRYWPGQSALGRRLSFRGAAGPWFTVVGVAGDVAYGQPGEAPRPSFYVPVEQVSAHRTTLVVRGPGDPLQLSAAVRGVVRELGPGLPIEDLGSLREALSLALLPVRTGGFAVAAFGVLGMLLASLGVYGVVAYGVHQRRREFGIRLALGAASTSVVRLAIGEGMQLVAIGVGAGLVLAAAAGLVAGRVLYGLAPVEPASLLGGAALFGGVALMATWIPARRAARVDPMVALRAE